MNDRELLEMAAKAAGRIDWDHAPHIKSDEGDTRPWWNPLTDDGDALRLQIALGLCVEVLPKRMEPFTRVGHIEEEHRDDAERATRRAIVRAAAEIGKALTATPTAPKGS